MIWNANFIGESTRWINQCRINWCCNFFSLRSPAKNDCRAVRKIKWTDTMLPAENAFANNLQQSHRLIAEQWEHQRSKSEIIIISPIVIGSARVRSYVFETKWWIVLKMSSRLFRSVYYYHFRVLSVSELWQFGNILTIAAFSP